MTFIRETRSKTYVRVVGRGKKKYNDICDFFQKYYTEAEEKIIARNKTTAFIFSHECKKFYLRTKK